MKKRGWQIVVNVLLCGFFLDFTLHEIHRGLTGEAFRYGLAWFDIYWKFDWLEADWGRLRIIDWSFRLQNLAMCCFLLIRTFHKRIDGNWLHQLVALGAFFSGALMVAAPGDSVPAAAAAITLAANGLGIASLLSLNRSFGILIANRQIKTRGVYAVVRHPMYLSDILLRAGFLAGYWSWMNLGLAAFSIGLYVIRALLEEKFLAADPEYRAYMRRVGWRLIPKVF